jgi:hypothetical protein
MVGGPVATRGDVQAEAFCGLGVLPAGDQQSNTDQQISFRNR